MSEIYFRDYVLIGKNRVLSLEQKKYIIENYGKLKTSYICKKLGLTFSQVRGYASNLGLKKNSNIYNFQYYILDRKSNLEYSLYNYINLKEQPLLTILYKSKYGKYYINQDFFEKIDNEWKAYWLGFLYADGYNNEKNGSIEVTLKESDYEHLLKFKESIQSDTPIKEKFVKKFKNYRIIISNKKMSNDLKNNGCFQNKSLSLTFPNLEIVPKYLIRHFIRGYLDGDGGVYLNEEKHLIKVYFEGTFSFLCSLKNILDLECGLISDVSVIKDKYANSYSLMYSLPIDVHSIYKYLYKYCNIYLDRKLEKFDKIFCLD